MGHCVHAGALRKQHGAGSLLTKGASGAWPRDHFNIYLCFALNLPVNACETSSAHSWGQGERMPVRARILTRPLSQQVPQHSLQHSLLDSRPGRLQQAAGLQHEPHFPALPACQHTLRHVIDRRRRTRACCSLDQDLIVRRHTRPPPRCWLGGGARNLMRWQPQMHSDC